MLIFTIVAVVYYLYRKNQSNAANSSTSGTGTTPNGTSDSLIPQFVNQVYTNGTPPSTPNPANPTQVQSVPAAPSGYSVTPYNNYADFGWSPVPGASKYTLKVYTQSGNKLVYSQEITGTHAKVTGLSPNTKYKYQIADASTGSQTPWVNFTTKGNSTPKAPVKSPKPKGPPKKEGED